MKGSEEFSYDWLGTPWHFASRKHQELFKSEPVKYAPQFGGYCAGEIASDGITINIDPDAWRIIDGKLYLVTTKATTQTSGPIRTKFAQGRSQLAQARSQFKPGKILLAAKSSWGQCCRLGSRALPETRLSHEGKM